MNFVSCILPIFALILTLLPNYTSQHNLLAHYVGEEQLTGVINAEVISGPNPVANHFWKYTIHIASFDGEQVSDNAAFFTKQSLLPGDQFTVWTSLQKPDDKQLPWKGSFRQYAYRNGLSLTAFSNEPAKITGQNHSPVSLLKRLFFALRVRHINWLLNHADKNHAGFFIALTTGNKALIPYERRPTWRHAGTGHLLAVSGMHFGVIAAIFWALALCLVRRYHPAFQRFGTKRLAAPVVAFALVFTLAWFGAPTSAIRAFTFASAAVVALIIFKPLNLLRILSVAAVLMLLYDPQYLFDLGFQLSFAATASIAAYLFGSSTERWDEPQAKWLDNHHFDLRRHLQQWGESSLLFTKIALVTSLGTAPFMIHQLGYFPVASLWSNLWAIPLFSTLIFPLTLVGSLGSLLATLFPFAAPFTDPVAVAILKIAASLIDFLEMTFRYTSGPATDITVGSMSLVVAVLSLGFYLLGLMMRRRIARGSAFLIAVLLLVGGVAYQNGRSVDEVRIYAIPVGQGDSTLLRLPGDHNLLIDAGGSVEDPDPGEYKIVPLLDHEGIDHLDAIIITHPDQDHYNGLKTVLENVATSQVIYDGCLPADSQPAHQIVAEVSQERLVAAAPKEVRLCRGKLVLQGEDKEWQLVVRRPKVESEDANERSLISLLWYRNRGRETSAIFTGDAEFEAEEWWRRNYGEHVDVLKTGHHGSRTSTGARFLEVVSPGLAFNSSARFSRFGHPNEETIEALRSRGIPYASTHRDGLVEVVMRDGKVECRTAASRNIWR